MRLATTLLLALVLAVPAAQAQPRATPTPAVAAPTEAEMAIAREQFRRGVTAVRAERWEEARDAFGRAYAISQQPLALFNLAGAQVRSGRLTEAAESYRRYLDMPLDGPAAAQRDNAANALAEVERTLAHLQVQAQNLDPADLLRLDERVLDHALAAQGVPADPGHHAVTVRRGTTDLARVEVQLATGSREVVRLQLPTRTPEVAVGVGPTPHPPGGDVTVRRRGVLRSPWFWGGVGVVVVGAAVATVFLTASAPPAFEGSLPPGRVTVQ
ncbi:MAG: tetratricopeptide repeat protein [Deltaproteobacteria bacterium]|nr:tetratricopeptide repeat protein [Deltaproteobacteria bacterium]